MTKNSRTAAEMQMALEGIFAELREADTATMDAAHLAPLASSLKAAADYLAKIDGEIRQRVLVDGKLLPGVSIKDVRANRIWNDAEAAATLAREQFGDAAFTTALKSPAQIEKLGKLGEIFVAMGSEKPNAGKTVAY